MGYYFSLFDSYTPKGIAILTSQYLALLMPSPYPLAKTDSELSAVMAEENWAMGCRLEGKLLSMLTTWGGRSARSAHSFEMAST